MADVEKKAEKKKKRSFPSEVGSAEKRADEVVAATGGRAVTSKSSWEKGAQSGEAYMLFSSVDEQGDALPPCHFRCVLCARFGGKEVIVKSEKGQTNLWSHLSSTHGLEKKKKQTATLAAKKHVKGQSSINSYGRVSDLDARDGQVVTSPRPRSVVWD